MTRPVDEARYLAAIARVCRGTNVIGVCFFVADGYLMTCAHVVSKALGYNRKSYQIPAVDILGQDIALEFRIGDVEQPATAKVVYWRCPQHDSHADNDVAVLKLQGAMPPDTQVLPLLSWSEYWNHDFRVLGFPSKLDPGGWATGTIMGAIYDRSGMVQMKDDQTTGYAIEPGFSGAPVWSPSLQNTIVGMTVARDKAREEAKVGFMLPVLRLKRALEAVELESLMDILEPQAVAVGNAVAIAYRAAVGDRLAAFPLSTQADSILALRDNLTKLLSIPFPGAASGMHVAVAVLTLPTLNLAAELRTTLHQWLQSRVADLTLLLAQAQQALDTALPHSATPTQAHLLLWVRTSPDYSSKERYLVSAVFIPNADAYDPNSGAGSTPLNAVERFRDPLQGDTVAKADLEQVLQACLRETLANQGQALRNRDLALELLLPIPLLDSAVEHWGEQATQELPAYMQELLKERLPIGSRYHVILRIAERVESYTDIWRPLWETKWAKLKATVDSQQRAKQVLISGHCDNFQAIFASADCLGMHLVNPLTAEERQRRLAELVRGANPAALWLRPTPPKTQCKRHFKDLLEHPLGDIASRVRAARQAAFAARSDRHIGHHLALLWENPQLVPVETTDATAAQPLEMPH